MTARIDEIQPVDICIRVTSVAEVSYMQITVTYTCLESRRVKYIRGLCFFLREVQASRTHIEY